MRAVPVKEELGQLGVQGESKLLLEAAPALQVPPDADAALAAPRVQFPALLAPDALWGPRTTPAGRVHWEGLGGHGGLEGDGEYRGGLSLEGSGGEFGVSALRRRVRR